MSEDPYRADLLRRLSRVRDDIGHIEGLIEQHVDFGDGRAEERLWKLQRDLKHAQLDAIRLEGLLTEAEEEPAA